MRARLPRTASYHLAPADLRCSSPHPDINQSTSYADRHQRALNAFAYPPASHANQQAGRHLHTHISAGYVSS